MNRKDIGMQIAQLRKQKNMTQKDLADMLGVSNRAVSKWETGEGYPDIEILPILADVLELTVDDLLKGEKTQISDNNHTDKYTIDEHIYLNNIIRFDNRFLLSISIVCMGIIASILALRLYNGITSSIFYSAIIGITFMIISLVLYINSIRLMKSSKEKFNQISESSDNNYNKKHFKQHILFYLLCLVLIEIIILVIPMYPHLCFGYYRVKNAVIGHFDTSGRMAIDAYFCYMIWAGIYVLLAMIGAIIIYNRIKRASLTK